MSESKFFSPKKVIFKEGQPADRLYIIKSGEVLCLKASKDRLIPVFRAQQEDIIGENAMLDGSEYGYSAITLGAVELMELSHETFSKVFKQSPDWLVDLTSTMINRFQNTANLIAENRAIHNSIMPEDEFPSSVEVEFKKLLN